MQNDYVDFLWERDICVVSFSSDSQKFFEFGGVLRDANVAHVMMRDSKTKWYQHGVFGIGNRNDVVEYIQKLKYRYKCVKTIGISSGAYGALLYGQLAGVNEVIAISPVTGKSVEGFDPKWHARIAPQPGTIDPSPIDDLLPLFKDGIKPNVHCFIGTGPGTEIDEQMATRIGLKPVVIPGNHSHHGLAKVMRDNGMLTELIIRGR